MRRSLKYQIIGTIVTIALMVIMTSVAGAVDSSFVKQRMGEGVNSYQPVVYPVLSYDGKRLYFSRKFHPFNVGSTKDPDDIWYCERSENGVWSDAVNIGTPLNSPESNVLCSISPSGTTALIQTTNPTASISRHVFALATSTPSGWSTPQPLTIRNFRNDSPNFYASLAYDDSTLLMALQTPTSEGGLDLYVSFREGATRMFSEPRNLGVTLNTKGTEGSPCLAYDGVTLYFSSDGHHGLGSQDIFVTRRLDSTWRHWTEPENLGPTINTTGLDHCFSLSADGNTAFIVSVDSTAQRGIYNVRIPPAAHMGMSRVRIDHPVTPMKSVDVELHFGVDATTPDDADLKSLLSILASHRDIGTTLGKNEYGIRIDAWADSTGDVEHNLHLSEQRLANVWKTLVHTRPDLKNVRVEKQAHGQRDARFDNSTDEGRRLNRSVRVTIHFSEKSSH